jgi:hypothetical protein
MATWTPTDLTDPEFVRTKLTPLDRSNALLTMTTNITGIQSALARNQAALAAAQELTNGPLSFGTVRDARRAAQEAQAAGAANAAELQTRYEELQAQRSIQTANADKYLRLVQSGEEALRTAQLAVNNLERAGAVPPGTNQFTPPEGYTGTINPPQEVQPDQNPNADPNIAPETTPGTEIQNPSPPISIDPNTDPNTNIAGEVGQDIPPPITQPNTVNYNNSSTSTAYDDDGNLNPGWAVDELGTPYFVESGPPLPTPRTTAGYQSDTGDGGDGGTGSASSAAGGADGGGASGALNDTRSTATNQDAVSFEKAKDWRVRLSLAPSAKYLYKNKGKEGILGPLAATNGVIFPYTPTISVVYAASYDASELVHSNYKIYNYKSSNVDTVTITGDFTAQDTNEANYLLAVIHFFKSVTKMFYGQDENPRNGTPPPLVYMSGMGTFQFDNHPLAVTNFTYSLPNEVDYIRAGSVTTEPGNPTAGQTPVNNTDSASEARIQASGLGPKTPNFQRQQATINSNATYVPTKMQIVITCIPIVTRNDISNNFSLRDYATGALLQGSKRNGGGIW